eukprot:6173420-Pleurochrysis_carterae.AAC.1
MLLTVNRAWQALAPYYHAPAIYCRASPLLAASGSDDYGPRPATSGAHDYTVMREAGGPLDQGVAMRSGVPTEKNAKEPRNDARMPMPKQANANE